MFPSCRPKGGEHRGYTVSRDCRSKRRVGRRPLLRLQVAGQAEQITDSPMVIVNPQNE